MQTPADLPGGESAIYIAAGGYAVAVMLLVIADQFLTNRRWREEDEDDPDLN